MKLLLVLIFFICTAIPSFSQEKGNTVSFPDKTKKTIVVETACGECQFGLPGKGCDLAVRINGKAYFVDGTDIDSHGDAHADDGFCNAIRKAAVQGTLIKNRFKTTYFHLFPDTVSKDTSKKF